MAQEDVAVAHECCTLPCGIKHGRAAIGVSHQLRCDQGIGTTVGINPVQVADRRALLLEPVVDGFAIDAPVRRLHRGANPVRIGHCLLQGHGVGR